MIPSDNSQTSCPKDRRGGEPGFGPSRAPRRSFTATFLVLLGTILLLGNEIGVTAREIVVEPGETLWGIARRELGNGNAWKSLAEENGLSSPHELRAGMRLRIPEETKASEVRRRRAHEDRVPTSSHGKASPSSRRPRQVPSPIGSAHTPIPTFSNAQAPHAESPSPSETIPKPRLPTVRYDLVTVPSDPSIRPLSLKSALNLARRRNLEILSKAYDPQAAWTTYEEARADFDPTLTFSSQQSWTRSRVMRHGTPVSISDARTTSYSATLSQTLPTGTTIDLSASTERSRSYPFPSTLDPTYTTDASLSVTQPILEGAGRVSAYAATEAAKKSAEAAEGLYERLSIEVIERIEKAYWNLGAAQASERVARASLELGKLLLKRNEGLNRHGLLPDVEVLTARAGVAVRREALVAATTRRENAAEELLFAIYGEDARNQTVLPWAVSEPPPPLTFPSPEVLEEEALRVRDDVRAARKTLDAAEITLKAAKKALLPNLDLTGSVGTGGTDETFGDAWRETLDNDNPNWSAGLVLTVPLGNRADRARFEAARIDYERKRLALTAVENRVRLAVRNAYREVRLGKKRLEEAVAARKLAEERLLAERRRFEFGLGDTQRVLDAEEDVVLAYQKEIEARYGLARAQATLTAAIRGNGAGH
ncbi:MAG: LysM peptidoglycan-binding domain-containing protein [Candidatus Hydrogenedentota bacterium]|nr:MAG: LysM peptidoglycan-binding domain-containing protein [Candidatus Hydrogenedentota bacterium]